MTAPKYQVQDVAKYFLALVDREVDAIDHLKLQKLCYYAQGFHLALTDAPLFPEAIEAWPHGPVCPDLYHQFKEYGRGPIPEDPDFDTSLFDDTAKSIIEEVYDVYGQYTGWKLRNITHAEPTWKSAIARDNKTITFEEMATFFKTQIEA